jgi:hypothetical protein
MKKSTKLIAMLTVITLAATMAAAAFADDKLYTSTPFSIPRERVEEDLSQVEIPEPSQEEKTEEYEPETVFEEEPEEEEGEKDESEVERRVLIKSSRGDVVVEGEIITLYSKLVGFDGVEVHYQWQVDRGDGNGWVDVEGATGATHSFVARPDTILYNWRLIVTVDE